MANTPKRKKLERNNADQHQGVQQGVQKFVCCKCGTAYSRMRGYFPVSHSPMYRGTGYLPICSGCVDELYEYYTKKLGSEREAMRRVCMKLDLYWNDSIFEMVERTAGSSSRVRNYIGKTNIIRYIDKSFDDTIEEEGDAMAISDAHEPKTDDDGNARQSEVPVDPALIDFWGPDFPDDMYTELDKRYREWTGGGSISEPNVRSLYRQICLLEVMIARDSAQGKPIDKNVNALNSLLGSMNMKPAQKKDDADSDLERMPLGVGIQKWEYSRPLPSTPDELRDTSNTIRNITTWFLGHVCKMVGLKNSYCKLYEDEMEKLRVKRPELDDEDDDTFLNDLFGTSLQRTDGGTG